MGLNAAVMEAGIPTLRQRLHEQTLRFWMGIHKLDDSHIHHKLAKYKGKKRFSSPLRKAAVLFRNLKACQADKIPAVGYEPWAPKAQVHILDREGAKQATAMEYANSRLLHRRLSEEWQSRYWHLDINMGNVKIN
jgi:hypothetical protein